MSCNFSRSFDHQLSKKVIIVYLLTVICPVCKKEGKKLDRYLENLEKNRFQRTTFSSVLHNWLTIRTHLRYLDVYKSCRRNLRKVLDSPTIPLKKADKIDTKNIITNKSKQILDYTDNRVVVVNNIKSFRGWEYKLGQEDSSAIISLIFL